MRNLKTIFLLHESTCPNLDLEIAMESILDGNASEAHDHMLNLMLNELSLIENARVPRTLMRFYRLSNKEGYDEVKRDISRGRLTTSNPFKFNDPMDPILKVWIELQKNGSWNKYDKKLFKTAYNALKNLRICCLTDPTRIGDNLPLMWSHYADSHKGIAITYKITEKTLNQYNDADHLLRIRPIVYRNHKIMDSSISIENALFAKSACWEYETEYRLFYFSTIDNDFKMKDKDKHKRADYITLNGFEIEAIYLGSRIDPHKEAELLRIASSCHIQTYKMKFDPSDITKLSAELISTITI